MNEAKAREILGDWIKPDGGLYCLGRYVSWHTSAPDACLDDNFTADELEAIAWWMRNKGQSNA